jgi:hypothetical protein
MPGVENIPEILYNQSILGLIQPTSITFEMRSDMNSMVVDE